MNANLIHKFPITDEEYNHVEGGALNVKQGVANESDELRPPTGPRLWSLPDVKG